MLARWIGCAKPPARSRGTFHYLVGSPAGVEHFTEQHDLGLFTTQTYLDAFTDAGLHVDYDADGISRRGLVIGVKPIV
jgi:hypothetical protein